MPVVELNASRENRRQRRAHLVKPRTSPQQVLPTGCPPSGGHQPVTIDMTAASAVLLELFGRPPVTFHRAFVDIAGSVNGAIWLSHALELVHEGADDVDGLSDRDCAEATGMTSLEQQTAREDLRKAGLLLEPPPPSEGPAKYRVDLERLARLLLEHSVGSWGTPGDHQAETEAGQLRATA